MTGYIGFFRLTPPSSITALFLLDVGAGRQRQHNGQYYQIGWSALLFYSVIQGAKPQVS